MSGQGRGKGVVRSLRGSGKRKGWLAAVISAAAVACALALAGSSGAADPTFKYFVDTSAASVQAGVPVTVTIHNCASTDSVCGVDSASPLGSATFVITGADLVQETLTASATG